jgi:(S)-ureidoglycine aminohydrolase
MSESKYASPIAGLPAQRELLTSRAIVTTAYTVIPKGVLRDIVTSNIPGWTKTRAWIIARPIAGFATTFSQMAMEISEGGGSDRPESEAGVESVVFVTEGNLELRLSGAAHRLGPGGYAFIPAGAPWQIHNRSAPRACFQWIRKAYERLEGHEPKAVVAREQDITPTPMPDTNGVWATTRFVDPDDLAYDMHVNIVNFEPGGTIPFTETHVMEHGIYILEGKAAYRLNDDWVEVEAGDFVWLRAFCPQAVYAGGPGRFRYLLYKNVNRQVRLT